MEVVENMQEDVHELQLMWASNRANIISKFGENYYSLVMGKFSSLVDTLDEVIPRGTESLEGGDGD